MNANVTTMKSMGFRSNREFRVTSVLPLDDGKQHGWLGTMGLVNGEQDGAYEQRVVVGGFVEECHLVKEQRATCCCARLHLSQI